MTSLVAAGCSEASPPLVAPAADEPFVACGRVVSPEPSLAPSVEAAAARWSAATGCVVRVAPGGVPLAFDSPILRPDGSHAPGVTEPGEDGRLRVRIDPRHRRRDEVVAHELGHVLGAGHTDGAGLMSGRKSHGDRIDADSLAAVCAALPCAAFTPESP